ncbi:unnamed protein product [Darwinula stevensoni]|uniref:Uncharacterized protein n=1 Tax=Darwinula stevensoni TaxID=69355 RepID=A0A7R9FNQ2_9CRUS|nr:unnamed protein product [Darwinula stevensoni]CAG0896702.1 unnamed protein product [Darwinula stevensoni]
MSNETAIDWRNAIWSDPHQSFAVTPSTGRPGKIIKMGESCFSSTVSKAQLASFPIQGQEANPPGNFMKFLMGLIPLVAVDIPSRDLEGLIWQTEKTQKA